MHSGYPVMMPLGEAGNVLTLGGFHFPAMHELGHNHQVWGAAGTLCCGAGGVAAKQEEEARSSEVALCWQCARSASLLYHPRAAGMPRAGGSVISVGVIRRHA